MNNIIPNLFIGDYTASQSTQLLINSNISNIVSAMKQSYPTPPGFQLLKVPIDDNDKTNICEWFDIVANWIHQKLHQQHQPQGVLVHCAAGVSRSTTLVAAYLMKAKNLTAQEAIFYISSKRPQTQPTGFFTLQLEIYERCHCQWDPVKYQEQRRFLMGFVADEMRHGSGAQKLVLAYYPSPAPSPISSTSDPFSNLTMTPLAETIHLKLTSPTSTASVLSPPPPSPPPQQQRKRLTQRTQPKLVQPKENSAPQLVEKLGQGIIQHINGKKLRCKMCRRELAARDHVLLHTPGVGQDAFGYRQKTKDAKVVKPDDQELQKVTGSSTSPAFPPVEAVQPASAGTSETQETLNNPRGIAALRFALPPSSNTLEQSATTSEAGRPLLSVDLPPPPHLVASPSHLITASGIPSSASPLPPPLTSPPIFPSPTCHSYFVEPLSWMSSVLSKGELVGKITCPNAKCAAKLGSFDWAGVQCSCGAWIVPGFQISRSKVDEV